MADNLGEGIITKGVGGTYTVRVKDGELKDQRILCQIRGGIRNLKVTPAVGDAVVFAPSGDPEVPYVIEEIKPRKNALVRPAVANIDRLVLTFAVSEPEPDLKMLDKMLIILSGLNIEPVIVFTKCDIDKTLADELYRIYSDAGYTVMLSSFDDMVKSEEMLKIAGDGIIGFAGPSGVGKSTLCNSLLDEDIMTVGEISDRLRRGKHTTRHVELFDFGDGFITDTPGFTQLSLFDLGIEYTQVVDGYPEIKKISQQCRFDDCRHISELGCSVLEALKNGELDQGRYDRYKEFYNELYSRRNDYSRRKKYE